MDALLLAGIIAGAVAVALLLIMRLKIPAFVALLIVSVLTAIAVGIPAEEIPEVLEEGMGGVLGFVAIVVGLGAIFSEVLRATGATERIARTLVEAFGEKKVPWSLGTGGFIVAIPVFFDVGLVLLMPMVYRLARQVALPLLTLAVPLLAGLSTAHSLIPPTPGPVAVAGVLGADLGWVIVFGVLAGIPAVIVAGVLYGKFIGNRIQPEIPDDDDDAGDTDARDLPNFWLILSVILIPLALILSGSIAQEVLDSDQLLTQILALVGDPFVALIVGVLLAFYVLGMRHGLDKDALSSVASKALEPVGMILLVTGAGGVFGEVLEHSGIDEHLEELLTTTGLPLIVLAFVSALFFRVSLGSSTVAMVAAASIVAQVGSDMDLSAPLLGAIVVAIGAGGTAVSHVNDSGFWLVNRYLNMDTKQTFATWTVMQTVLAVTAFAVVLPVSLVL
ncbi:GntP family permease [Nesterenkonia muleiensis]|uniref:GntP family permease n=1 Tax=Nesterenkonia muleiensis TaxID=2282648 RepID=UPI000E735C59|nr:gluconate:H+ symporter [Nesterenkonia muleiensis]